MNRTFALLFIGLAAPLRLAAAPPRAADGHPDLSGVDETFLSRPFSGNVCG